MIGIVIITHGDFAKTLLETAESIVGSQQFVFAITIPYSEDPKSVQSRLENEIGTVGVIDDWLVLADMVGGTPCNICLPLVEKFKERFEVVSGVNLYMIISAFINRNVLSLSELKKKVIEDARAAVMDVKEKFFRISANTKT